MPLEPTAAERIGASFTRQAFMRHLGATLGHVAPGEVEILMPLRPELTQQTGSLHAGATTAIADSACGYAALTLMPAGSEVVSVEFKVNLLAPATGAHAVARARVLRAGRTLTVCRATVVTVGTTGEETAVLEMQATMMAVPLERPAR